MSKNVMAIAAIPEIENAAASLKQSNDDLKRYSCPLVY
jgi:hypothetical protein